MPTIVEQEGEDRVLRDELSSLINTLELGRLALSQKRYELIPTALEDAFEKIQYLLDDYCVCAEEN